MVRVLIIEDHPLFRLALVQLLKGQGATVFLSDDVENSLQVLKEQRQFNLVVMDLGLPGALKGCEAVSAVRQACLSIPILVVSGRDDEHVEQEVLTAGANAFLVKTASPAAFEIKLRQLVGTWSDLTQHRLTERQQVVLRFLCEGLSNKEIARQLDLSDATVKMHMTAILRALEVRTRTQAILTANELGLLTTQMSANKA